MFGMKLKPLHSFFLNWIICKEINSQMIEISFFCPPPLFFFFHCYYPREMDVKTISQKCCHVKFRIFKLKTSGWIILILSIILNWLYVLWFSFSFHFFFTFLSVKSYIKRKMFDPLSWGDCMLWFKYRYTLLSLLMTMLEERLLCDSIIGLISVIPLNPNIHFLSIFFLFQWFTAIMALQKRLYPSLSGKLYILKRKQMVCEYFSPLLPPFIDKCLRCTRFNLTK